MKQTIGIQLLAVLGAVGLAACGPDSPSDAPPPEPEASAPAEPAEAPTEEVSYGIHDAVLDPDPYARARRLGTLLPTLGPEAVVEVRRTLKDLTIDFGAVELELLLRFWASHEPADASRWAANVSPHAHRLGAVFATLSQWAEADPEGAEPTASFWAGAREDIYAVALRALVRGWYRADPTGVARYIRNMSPGAPRQLCMAAFARALVGTEGTEAAMRWAEAEPEVDSLYKLNLYQKLGTSLADFDPEAAIRWCDAHCGGPHGRDLRSMIARRWVLSDGVGALTWLSTAPEGYERDLAVRIAYSVWARMYDEEASDWMATKNVDGSDAWLEPAIPLYARQIARHTPNEAIAWAQRIDGEEEREIVLIDVARTWRKRDEEAAEAWLEESPLSEEAREKVRAEKRDFKRPFSD